MWIYRKFENIEALETLPAMPEEQMLSHHTTPNSEENIGLYSWQYTNNFCRKAQAFFRNLCFWSVQYLHSWVQHEAKFKNTGFRTKLNNRYNFKMLTFYKYFWINQFAFRKISPAESRNLLFIGIKTGQQFVCSTTRNIETSRSLNGQ